jgi:hypothetical protein
MDTESRGGIMPDDEVRDQIADRIWEAEKHLELRSIDKEQACEFVARHHSLLPYCNPRGMMYAIGAYWHETMDVVDPSSSQWPPLAHRRAMGARRLPRRRHPRADQDRLDLGRNAT